MLLKSALWQQELQSGKKHKSGISKKKKKRDLDSNLEEQGHSLGVFKPLNFILTE